MFKSKVRKIYLLRASASQKGLKGTNTRLKHRSEQFVREKTYKGGRGAKAPRPPFVGVSLKILRTAA